MENKRTEIASIWVTPEIKKEIDKAKDNNTQVESIIKRFIASEESWLESEIKEMDEYTIRYKAKLIGIRDAFSKAQGEYTEQIEEIYAKAADVFSKIDKVSEKLESKIKRAYSQIKEVSQAISYISTSSLEHLLDLTDRYNKMSDSDKEIIKFFLDKSK